MGTTQVKDCEELANAPIKTPLVSVPKSNFRLLAKNEEQERRSKSLEEINLSDKEKNLGRKKFWAGHSNLISNLDLHKLDDNHLAQETLLLKQGISSAFQVNKKSLGRGLASDNDIQSPDFISNNNSFTRQQFQAANGEEQKNIDDDLSRFRSQTPHRRFGNQNQTFQFNLKNRGCITPMNHNAIHLNGEKKQKALDLSHDARKTNVEDAWNQFQDIFLNAIKKQTNSKNIEEERKESKKSKEWQVIYKPSRNSNQNNRDSCQEDNNKIETPDGKEDMQFSFKICGLDLLAFKTKTNQVNQNQVMDAKIQESYKTIKFLHYLPTCQAQVLDERNSQGHEDSQFFHQLKKENMQNDTIQTDFKRWIVKLRLTEQLQRSFYAKDRPQALEIVEEINKIIKAGNNYPEVFKFNQRFNIHGMPIGEGAFGKVYKGYDCIDQKNQSAVAIKEVLIDTKNRMIAEIQMEECDICYFLMKYPHPNVMQFKNLILYNNEIKVAMEYVRGQDMNQWAIQIHNEGRYSERLIKKVFFQVCQGVHHLHIHGIVHRDIKLENILVSLDDQGEPQIKVLDFGLASIVFQGQVILRPCGSLAFSSPEIVRKTFYDQKTDVWSLGVVLYCILTQRLPFFRINPDETKYNILKQEITFTSKHWAVISPKAKDLISKMLCKDASQRISIDEVVQHPWFDVLNNK